MPGGGRCRRPRGGRRLRRDHSGRSGEEGERLPQRPPHREGGILLIEKEEYLGGTISRVGMESVSWWQYNDAVKSDGLVKELEDLAKSMRATSTFP